MNEACTRDNRQETKLRQARLVVPGVGSDHCAGLVAISLKRLDGVSRVQTNIASHSARVVYAPDKVGPEALKAAVDRAGYDVESEDAPLVAKFG